MRCRRHRGRGSRGASAEDRTDTAVADRGCMRALGSGCSRNRNRRRRPCCRCACHRHGHRPRRDPRSGCGRSRRRSRRRRRRHRRSGRRRRGRSSRCGEEEQRIHVTVRILGVAEAEMNVWGVVLDFSGRADRPDDGSLGHGLAPPNARRAEMGQGHGVAVGRLDRHDFAAHGNRADKRHGACCRRENGVSGHCADVDSAVLPRSVWIAAEDELLKYRTSHGPGPRSGSGHDREGRRERDDQGLTHLCSPCCLVC